MKCPTCGEMKTEKRSRTESMRIATLVIEYELLRWSFGAQVRAVQFEPATWNLLALLEHEDFPDKPLCTSEGFLASAPVVTLKIVRNDDGSYTIPAIQPEIEALKEEGRKSR